MARLLGPAAAIEVRDRAGLVRNRQVRVAAADRGAPLLRRVAGRVGLDLAGAAEERLALALGEFGEVVRLVDLLEA